MQESRAAATSALPTTTTALSPGYRLSPLLFRNRLSRRWTDPIPFSLCSFRLSLWILDLGFGFGVINNLVVVMMVLRNKVSPVYPYLNDV